jgi:Notch-like protein
VVDTCDQPSAAVDATCDGIDDDCNGRVDDGFVPAPVSCGVGACARTGQTRCVDARVESACVPGAAAPIDETCDGVDDDCDGVDDDDARPAPTACGVGACAASGIESCVEGSLLDTCTPHAPGRADDPTCNGVDDDCDGATDEDFVGVEVTCGAGACAAVGQTHCVAGRVVESCHPAAAPSPVDTTCDARDDDCDGRVDDDFVGAATRCGVGACRSVGRERCVAGTRSDACQPGAPAANDATCNGLDDDCDGEVDEDFQVTPSRCGVGACDARGETRCVAGRLVDDCTPGAAAARDSTCDRVDDDCDGRVDDDVAPIAVTCGEGSCAAEGERVCELGRLVERCRPIAPAGPDDDCDGRDQDCDGSADDDFVPETILCGEGACGAMGTRDCVDGRAVDTCHPFAPAADDHTCDALDDDCDGETDEDAPGVASRCGVGACAALGEVRCIEGAFVDTCTPGAPAAADSTCDDRDDDCDGLVDEDCAPDAPDAPTPHAEPRRRRHAERPPTPRSRPRPTLAPIPVPSSTPSR